MPKKALEANQTPRLDIYSKGDTSKAELLFELLEEYGMTFLPWQKLVLRRWLAEDEDGKFVNLDCGLSVPRQNGKVLKEDTEILTENGWTTVGEIKVGDTIFGDDGKPTKVIAKYEPDEPNWYEIDFGNAGRYINETITAGGCHLWEMQCKDWSSSRIKDTNWIYENFNRLKHSKRSLSVKLAKPIELPEKELPIDPYILGLWLGDGSSFSASISCHVDDFQHYSKAFSKIGECTISATKGNGIHFRVRNLFKLLKRNSLINNKHIPNEYLLSSKEQRLELLRGLMDSDGHAEKQSGRVSFSQSGRPEFVKQFMELVCSLGMKPVIREKKLSESNPNHKDAQEVYFDVVGNEPVFNLPRKQAQFEKYYTKEQQFNAWYIKDIRKIERPNGHHYCLAVDNLSHLFVCTRSYIPTHNTEIIVGRVIYGIIFRKANGLFTAQQQGTADVVKRRVQDFFYDNEYEEIFNMLTPQFRNKPKNYDYIEFMNGARYVFRTRTRLGGLGTTNDDLICDEAADMTDDHQATLLPTISAAKGGNPQVIYAGTPPMATTVGEVFARTRKQIMTGKAGCWTEWSVDTMTDKEDIEAWYKTNPSLDTFLIKKVIEAEARSLATDDFNRMRLGWWSGVEDKRAIAQSKWDDCFTEKPEFDESYKPVFAVKFAPDRSAYSLAVAQPLTNKKIHCEIVMQRPMSEGFNKLSKWLIERWRNCSKIILDGATGQALMFEDLTSAGVSPKKIIQPNMKEIVAAHQFIYDGIIHKEFSHYDQPLLNQTVRVTKMRQMGRYGGFGWESMSKEMSTAALDAATYAYWGQRVFGKKSNNATTIEERNEKWKKILSQI